MFGGVNRAADALGEAPRIPTRHPLHSISTPMNRGAPQSSTQNPHNQTHGVNDQTSLAQRPQMDTRRNESSRRLFPTYESIMANHVGNHRALQTNTIDDMSDSTRRAVLTRAEAFLDSLKPLSLIDLSKNNRDCPICLEPYKFSRQGERPVRLPCLHVVGRECLEKWVKSDIRNRNNNACPYVRHHSNFLPLLFFMPAN